MPGTILGGVLEAQHLARHGLDCLDHSLSHHAVQLFLPDQAGWEIAVEEYDSGRAPYQVTATFDQVLVAVGRRPNGRSIGADRAGVAVDERGFINVDKQQRTNEPHIFAIGDVVGRVREGTLWLDVRTLLPGEEEAVIGAVRHAVG